MGFIPSDFSVVLMKKQESKIAISSSTRREEWPQICNVSCPATIVLTEFSRWSSHPDGFQSILNVVLTGGGVKRRGIIWRPARPTDFRPAWIMLPLALMRCNNFQNMSEMPVDFRALWNPGLKWEVLLPGHNFENRVQEDSKWVSAKPSGSCEELNFDIWSWTTEGIQFLSFWRISDVLIAYSTAHGMLVLLYA